MNLFILLDQNDVSIILVWNILLISNPLACITTIMRGFKKFSILGGDLIGFTTEEKTIDQNDVIQQYFFLSKNEGLWQSYISEGRFDRVITE